MGGSDLSGSIGQPMVEREVILIGDFSSEEVSRTHGLTFYRGSNNESSSSSKETMAPPPSAVGVSRVCTPRQASPGATR